MFTRNVILTVAAMFTPMLAAAATYDAGSLNFSTETRQNVWAPGDALEKSGNKFVGETWNTGTPDFGLIVGEASKKIRSPTYDTDLAAWNFCGTITIGGVCGLPKPQEFITTVDTRTGFVASIDSTGKAGFDIDYKLSAGSFGASLDYGVSAVLPDTVKKGEAFQIAANSIFSDGTIDVQAPTIEASIAAVLKVKADAKGTGCFIAFGCSTSTTNLATFDIDAELISVDPSEISYLKGLLPPGVSLSTPLLKQTVATLKAGIVNGVPAVYAEGIGIPPVGATAGIDLGSISVEPPKFDDPEDVGKKIGDSLLANATGEFLEMNADLDGLLPVPKGGASAALGPIDLSFDLFDFDAGPSLDVFQDLKLTPKLMVKLGMSRAVEIGGNLVDTFTGAWDSLPEMKIFGKTTFLPEFYVEAFLVTKTGLQIGLEFSMEFLKASASFAIAGLNVVNLAVGPLFEKEFGFDPEWAKIAVYESSFMVNGFNHINARSFTLTPEDHEVAPVPLPAAAWLLMAGLGALWSLRRKGSAASGRPIALA